MSLSGLFYEKDREFQKCYFNDIKCDNLEFASLTSAFTLPTENDETDVLVRGGSGELAVRVIPLPAYFSVYTNNLSNCPNGNQAVLLQNVRYQKNVNIGSGDVFIPDGTYNITFLAEVENTSVNPCVYEFEITNLQNSYFRKYTTKNLGPGEFENVVITDLYDVGENSDVFIRSQRLSGTGQLVFAETNTKFMFNAFKID